MSVLTRNWIFSFLHLWYIFVLFNVLLTPNKGHNFPNNPPPLVAVSLLISFGDNPLVTSNSMSLSLSILQNKKLQIYKY